jgi:hypothetical protein
VGAQQARSGNLIAVADTADAIANACTNVDASDSICICANSIVR